MPELFGFQEEDVTKLSEVPSGLNANDMGLGKTVEAIEIDKRKRAADAKGFELARGGKALTLVVCPLGVVHSWERHFKTWNPDLKVHAINPKDRDGFLAKVKRGSHDVYIIHWQGLRLIEGLREVFWFHIIADEVHRAKNRKSQQTVALKLLHTDHKLGCSGTPADNRPDDFWSVLNWLYPKKFSSYWKFRNYHMIIQHHDLHNLCGCSKSHRRAYDEIIGVDHLEELHDQLAPFYVRHLKTEVWDDMPEKYYTPIEVDLHPQQRRAYEDMRTTMLAWVGKHEDQPISAPVVIAQLTRLQQFACAFAKMEYGKLLMREPSSKLDAALDIIEDNPDKQIVCFSQSKQLVYMLNTQLVKRGIKVAMYTGDNKDTRDRMVEEFQQGERKVFAGTISAGGEGIELTASHTEIFFDRAWSPSRNNQAEDRCWRFGQKNAVQVFDIVARDTIDRGRNQRISLKWSWLKQILGDKPTGTSEWLDSDGVFHQQDKSEEAIFAGR